MQAFGFGPFGKKDPAAVVLVLAWARDGFATCECVCMPLSYAKLSNKREKRQGVNGNHNLSPWFNFFFNHLRRTRCNNLATFAAFNKPLRHVS